MSVQKLWLAGDSDETEFSAELNPDALEPKGNVIRDSNSTALDPANLGTVLKQTVLVASLCNVATYVLLVPLLSELS